MKVDLFDFELPAEQIALRPAVPRDAARMLVVRPGDDPELVDGEISGLADALQPGDLLVLNDTRVIPARLRARRERPGATGASIEVLLHQRLSTNQWKALARPSKRLKADDLLDFTSAYKGPGPRILQATVVDMGEAGEITLKFAQSDTELDAAIAQHGDMPLPPYIASKRPVDKADESDYQTVFARQDGAVAAPTAGLHLTEQLFEKLAARNIGHCFVTLHVGAGTFLPVKASDTKDHRMHAEWGEISNQTAGTINAAHENGGRIVAVGTTSLRLLESAIDASGQISPYSGTTDIFITPGHRIHGCDALVTNFHLPKSTLFMLVSAFCGLETMQRAYSHAIGRGYRFYSYGDACLLFRQSDT